MTSVKRAYDTLWRQQKNHVTHYDVRWQSTCHTMTSASRLRRSCCSVSPSSLGSRWRRAGRRGWRWWCPVPSSSRAEILSEMAVWCRSLVRSTCIAQWDNLGTVSLTYLSILKEGFTPIFNATQKSVLP